jgi:hypothetical protein
MGFLDCDFDLQGKRNGLNCKGTKEKECPRKRARTFAEVPRVMKTDIRRHFASMFLNTLNSADLIIMQDFFNTFMARPCKLIGNLQSDQRLNLPSQLIADGPRLTAHVALGIFLMFPDMAVRLVENNIITSPSWVGSKIVISVELVATKVSLLPTEVWMPSKQVLPELYKRDNLYDMLQAANRHRGAHPAGSPTAGASASEQSLAEQRAAAALRPETQPSLIPAVYTRSYIPASFVGTVTEGLIPLLAPIPLRAAGQIVFFLDGNNHIQHIALDMFTQKDA